MAPLEAMIEKECDDNWHDCHANHDGDERKSNEIGTDPVHRIWGAIGTNR